MNFFKKLFGPKNNSLGTASIAELRKLTLPATSIFVEKPKREPENSALLSHFGGQPYFEEGESWPVSQNGRPMDFVFQVFNDSYAGIPENIKLIQFFYDFEQTAWETDDDGWKVKIYEELTTDKLIKPEDITDKTVKYCEITIGKILSLPNWEALNELYPEISDEVTAIVGDDNDYEAYEEACIKITGNKPETSSSFGGYPDWIQGAEGFDNSEGKPMDLLFQIDSEDNANLMWGDMGTVYVFYDKKTQDIRFILQCF